MNLLKEHRAWIGGIFLLLVTGFTAFFIYNATSSSSKPESLPDDDASGVINPLYFYSDRIGSSTPNCPSAIGIDWDLAIVALSDYMQYGNGKKNGEDFGPAEIQRNFDENCERNMTIYNDMLRLNPDLQKQQESARDTLTSEADLPTIKRSEIPDIVYGGFGDDINEYSVVIVGGPPIEEPVTISFSNEHRALNLKSDFVIKALVADKDFQNNQARANDDLTRFGEIARQYLPFETISSRYLSDVDNDNVDEALITVCGMGANHCSERAEIIKGSEIIFSVELYANSWGIEPAPDGFYVNWTQESDFRDDAGSWVGYCCNLSHHKTLFVFQNGQFMPTKQWRIPHVWKRVVE